MRHPGHGREAHSGRASLWREIESRGWAEKAGEAGPAHGAELQGPTSLYHPFPRWGENTDGGAGTANTRNRTQATPRANAACGRSRRSLRASPEGRTVSSSDRGTRVTCDDSSRPCAGTPGAVCHAGNGSATVLGRQITSTLYFHIILEHPSNTSKLRSTRLGLHPHSMTWKIRNLLQVSQRLERQHGSQGSCRAQRRPTDWPPRAQANLPRR